MAATKTEINLLLNKLRTRQGEIDKFIDKSDKQTRRLTVRLNRMFYDLLVNGYTLEDLYNIKNPTPNQRTKQKGFLDRLLLEGSTIRNTPQNASVLQQLKREVNRWLYGYIYPTIVTHLSDKIEKLSTLNGRYYKLLDNDTKKVQNIASNTKKQVRAAVGIFDLQDIPKRDRDNYTRLRNVLVEKGGRIDGLASMNNISGTKRIVSGTLQNSIVQIFNRAILEGGDYFDYKQQINQYATGGKLAKGVFSHYLDTAVFDLKTQVVREQANEMSKVLKMDFFIYMGGLRGGSRKFCIDKSGKLFHREDAKKWESQTWDGKRKSGGYVGIVHLGDINCYHRTGFVTNEVARQIDFQKYSEYIKD